MRLSSLAAIFVVVLLVLSGCTGLTGETEPSPDASPSDFPNAADINKSVFDTHATAMGNTSFNLTLETNRTDRNPMLEENVTYMNDTWQYRMEPSDSQYHYHTSGYFTGNGSIYSNGSAEYVLSRENDWKEMRPLFATSALNESGENYLWQGFFRGEYDYGAINATYERKGIETFQGDPVMRYEATGADALSGKWAADENSSWAYENFSATLLIDQNGVIRHYQYTFVKPPEHQIRVRYSVAYTVSDVGDTDVEKPDWAANATAE